MPEARILVPSTSHRLPEEEAGVFRRRLLAGNVNATAFFLPQAQLDALYQEYRLSPPNDFDTALRDLIDQTQKLDPGLCEAVFPTQPHPPAVSPEEEEKHEEGKKAKGDAVQVKFPLNSLMKTSWLYTKTPPVVPPAQPHAKHLATPIQRFSRQTQNDRFRRVGAKNGAKQNRPTTSTQNAAKKTLKTLIKQIRLNHTPNKGQKMNRGLTQRKGDTSRQASDSQAWQKQKNCAPTDKPCGRDGDPRRIRAARPPKTPNQDKQGNSVQLARSRPRVKPHKRNGVAISTTPSPPFEVPAAGTSPSSSLAQQQHSDRRKPSP